MGFIIEGTIVQALPIQSGVSQKTGNQWQRASYVIEHEHGQYPKRMLFDVMGQKIQEMNLQVGETVKLHMNCDARESNGRLFNSIDAWKVERQVQQQYAPQGGYQQAPQQYQQPAPQQYQQPAPQQFQNPAPFPPQQAPFPPQQNNTPF